MVILLHCLKVIPIVLSLAWIFGAFAFYWRRERRSPVLPPRDHVEPPVSILIPCHNEEQTITRTIQALDHLEYPEYEIIAINDGSRDRTLAVLHDLAKDRPYLRVVNLLQNKGKAAALNIGIMSSRHEYIICIDADSELNAYAPSWLIPHLVNSPRVAAVTGNPRVKNRGTLVGRIQVGEFSAIIGTIKRYHQVIGKLFALSGVIVAFKKRALLDIGLLDTNSVTEDICVTWKLQRNGWDVRYEPRAVCDVLMPDTLKGLWKQRMRWAQGGFEVMSRNADILLWRGHWGLKILYAEYLMSLFWVFSLPVVLIAGLLVEDAYGVPLIVEWTSPLTWGIFLTGVLSSMQFIAGFIVHGKYEKDAGCFGYWTIWYPFIYWILNSAVLFVAIPKAVFGHKAQFSTWVSPDRGGLTYGTTKS